MEQAIQIIQIVAGVLSATASFGVIFYLHQMKETADKVVDRYQEEKDDFDDTLMAIADVISNKRKRS